MYNAYLGLGSNIGNRLANLRAALRLLEERVALQKRSSVYESVPDGVEGEQPYYLNLAVHIQTTLTPRQLLALAKKIEQDLGRQPQSHLQPRPIDIDILLYDDLAYADDDLVIPHPRMHERHFVLVPLEEIASYQFHAKLKKPVIDMLDELGGYERVVRLYEEQL